MRVAALYDIHGNLPALEAVLRDIRDADVDRIVVGGDVGPGPMPRETLACLLELKLPVGFIQGNGEVAVLEHAAGTAAGTLPEQAREAIRWTAQQLHAEDRRVLARWPKTLSLEIDGLGEVLFCHATPRSHTEIFTRLTSEERLRPAFEGINAPVVVCGHTHMQFDRTAGRIRVMNAGSVGMPFGQPGAYWLLLATSRLELRHTPYDLQNAADRIRATAYPQAEDFASRNILRPPSEQEMLEAFCRVELR
jgi:diadenosine tetraphosphatase ApaH/serine/threonine PP2A family protein phosphatase